MAGRRDRRSQEEMLHPEVVLDQPEDERDIPTIAISNLIISWSRMTVLLMTVGEVYFLVTRGWTPNWRASRAIEIMAGRERDC